MLKAIILLALSSFAIRSNEFLAGREPQKKTDKPAVEKSSTQVELKTLAAGSQSAIEESFVAVIRDHETYARLREMDAGLPKLEPDFFRLNTVIAAYLGTRNTGGYSVAITREPSGRIRVLEKAPPKGAMTAQVITSPFKMVSFAANETTPVDLVLDPSFRQQAQLYRVSSGEFKVSGGITGRTQSFKLEGKLQITRLGDLVTVGFALVGSDSGRSLRDVATGVVKDNEIAIGRLSHGSLVDPPTGDLQASGRFVEKNKVTLELVSKAVKVSESYSGRGSIEAERAERAN